MITEQNIKKVKGLGTREKGERMTWSKGGKDENTKQEETNLESDRGTEAQRRDTRPSKESCGVQGLWQGRRGEEREELNEG